MKMVDYCKPKEILAHVFPRWMQKMKQNTDLILQVEVGLSYAKENFAAS